MSRWNISITRDGRKGNKKINGLDEAIEVLTLIKDYEDVSQKLWEKAGEANYEHLFTGRKKEIPPTQEEIEAKKAINEKKGEMLRKGKAKKLKERQGEEIARKKTQYTEVTREIGDIENKLRKKKSEYAKADDEKGDELEAEIKKLKSTLKRKKKQKEKLEKQIDELVASSPPKKKAKPMPKTNKAKSTDKSVAGLEDYQSDSSDSSSSSESEEETEAEKKKSEKKNSNGKRKVTDVENV